MVLAGDPILDVEMDGPGLGLLPAFPRIETAEDKVGRVVGGPQVFVVDRGQDIDDAFRGIAVDAVLVFVEQGDARQLPQSPPAAGG